MKKFLVYFSLSLCLLTSVPHYSEARAVLKHARSWSDTNGCIWIEEIWEHRALGFNWYTTTVTYSPNCNAHTAP